MAIAVKFFIPLLAPLLLVLVAQRKDERFAQLLTAVFVLAGSFEAMSLFMYTPSDFRHLIWMLRTDNMVIGAAGTSPLNQVRLYSWGMVSAVGVPVAAACGIGIVHRWGSLRRWAAAQRQAWHTRAWQALVTPESLFIAAFGIHAALIIAAKVHFERHLLVFIPATCILASRTILGPSLPSRITPIAGRLLAAAIILVYQTYDAIAIESLYKTDIRAPLADWAAIHAAQGANVIDIDDYLEVRAAKYNPRFNPLSMDAATFLVTCDLEYVRYLGHTSAKQIFHATAGQPGVEFFNEVFRGTSKYGFVASFQSQPRGVELRLIDANIMAPLDVSVPHRCYVLGLEDQLPPEAQNAIRSQVDTSKDAW
jgi:hypothetical protein